MILVDTSVWVDYFAGRSGPHVARLEQALGARENIFIVPIIVTQVLQGFRSDRDFREAERFLTLLPQIPLTLPTHVDAAKLYRALRKKGLTVRGAVDCVITQAAIEAGTELLTADRDFRAISRHSRLKLCAV